MKEEYLLLTPGPLTTSKSVKAAMDTDICTWDNQYKQIVEAIRAELLELAGCYTRDYTTILMQGSGTFGVEAIIWSALGSDDKLLVCSNGAYGERIYQIAKQAGIDAIKVSSPETRALDLEQIATHLKTDQKITHVAFVHCETTTGVLNPLTEIMGLIKQYRKISIVDAMSSFGGIPIDVPNNEIDFIISSANKCIQGVPGFSFIIAKRSIMQRLEGNSKSLSLDLYQQWKHLELEGGKFRFTSPTHVILAFAQALKELKNEGGIVARNKRYQNNQKLLVENMEQLGYQACVKPSEQSPIITTFHCPTKNFTFASFYSYLKANGFIIYPGKLSNLAVFRIGNIGEINSQDITNLSKIISNYDKERLT
ncbi:MAG: 2-aminoethylphosphonate--pyruvate transaminase [Culicoidibacterales bacterium]